MKNRLYLFLSLLVPYFAFSQETSQIDSLKRLLNDEKDVAKTVSISKALFESYLYTSLDSADRYRKKIGQISKQYSYTKGNYFYNSQSGRYYFAKGNLDSALLHIETAANIAETLGNKAFMADNYKKISIIYDIWRKDSLSLKFINKALANAKDTDDWRLLSSIYVALGNRSFQFTQYPEALSYYLKTDSIYTTHNSLDKSLAAAYSNIGFIYTELKDSLAIRYLKKSINIYHKLGHREGVHFGKMALGVHYAIQGNCKTAIQYLIKAKDFYEAYKDASMLAEIYMRLGNCYLKENIEEAEKYLLKSNSFAQSSKKITLLASNNTALGNLYNAKEEYTKAIAHYKKTIQITSGLENDKAEGLNALAAHKGLIKAYTALNDFESAVKTYEKKVVIEDSIKRYQNRLVVEELEKKYQTEKKEQEIQLLTSQAELKKQKSENEKTLFIVGILILGIALIALYILFRNKQKTNGKLRQLESAKSRFFANISHEFRTPLTLISGPVAHQLSKKGLTPEDKTDLNLIDRNANRLLNLVNQLLDLSKIEAGRRKLKISKGNLNLFLEHLVEPFSYQSTRKGLTFNSAINVAEEAWFDRDLIEKIVSNLLSNALKYSEQNGHIDFRAEMVNAKVCISVTNENSSLTEKELPTLFDRFYQNNSVNEGFGIGLSLVKELSLLSHGKVKADKPSSGTVRFRVTLPISKDVFAKEDFILTTNLLEKTETELNTELILEPEDIAHTTGESLPLLLIVDDNEEIRLFIKSLLKNDYRILQAKNGKEGIDKALETIPDLIISDIMMPVKDGIYLSNTLKADERTSHIPIVLLTAKSAEEDELLGLKTGADAYMIKPFKEEKLRVIIEKLIASRATIQDKFSQQVFLKPQDMELTPIDSKLLNRIQSLLDDQLTDPNFGAQVFSDQIGLSRMHLHRKLKALTGFSTTEFIRIQRLKLAAKLLKDGGVNISEIAYTVGFNQPAYFSTCFKQYFGCSPSDYAF
ncbi:response regulator [Gelatiniphilus marinus]|uniref:histidine kinase n=1 Tax=Gelatiniphilus marinus TaxID=1759464 RepID=A0ABW5JVN9_9FLAO